MNWLESLCELYQKNEKIAGVYMKGRFDEDLILDLRSGGWDDQPDP